MLNYRVSADARPQVQTLLLITLLSVALWFIPYADYLTYPFRLFVTFIHEGGHAFASWLTGNSVRSLSVMPDTSGVVFATQGGFLAQMIVSSAGYVGAMAFGALLLVLIRRAVTARKLLFGMSGLILFLTLVFGLTLPLLNLATNSWDKIPFTVGAGLVISGGLFAVARWSNAKVAAFLTSFLAVQCVLNALLDLKTIFFLSSPLANYTHSDAANMANLTGLPRLVWATLWVVISLGILSLALRVYAIKTEKSTLPSE